jgi:acetyl esterase/lipase
MFGKGDAKRDAGLVTPENVTRYDDILYGKSKKWQVLDVYRPKTAVENGKPKPLPVIVSVHGGGWMYGNKEVYQWYCMSLAQRGFAVVNFTYRLAPEFKFPAGLEDTNMVFQWVLGHGEEYGFDTEHVFAVGDSAGGHMLCMYAAICTNLKYAEKFPFTVPDGFAPTAVGLNCGVYHIDMGPSGDSQTQRLMKGLLREKGSAAETDMINPLPYITGDFPPAYIMTANNDRTVDPTQAQMLETRLREQRVIFSHKEYGTKEKPLDHVFHCNVRMEEAKLCNEEECAFFRSFL